jgi:hypothetical protein
MVILLHREVARRWAQILANGDKIDAVRFKIVF